LTIETSLKLPFKSLPTLNMGTDSIIMEHFR